MKRLTEPKGFVNGTACQERGVELYWRLKQYEDIGLDPEEIRNLLEHQEIEIGKLRQELADERYRHDRLQDFEVAEAEELRKAREQNRWIPVTERLPQEDLPFGALCEVVQVLLQGGAVTVGWCNRGLKCWYYLPVNETKFVGHGYDLTPVVAWKPLSQPPKEVTA